MPRLLVLFAGVPSESANRPVSVEDFRDLGQPDSRRWQGFQLGIEDERMLFIPREFDRMERFL